mmetsp:Transcript_30300/g.46260  ORF Transcript_30300/g.46260 Transcript_30300/m.46260 type:complete len:745 (+) Transcript_30300:78-2312(+)|eukprot:CAMPEP_0194211582 /NCGR_PEP_ID=MMETSP0156-20130528/10675_1 /TAXON_ID=33649 /ORGANISM="Thalassionema nitzschioides, Strain L26-B" /LENGTH=744 /DNA_ID=CAMNT_0038939179 /DNA_START=31 /DNA_END=2265 /DNA_ORIENTATION=-
MSSKVQAPPPIPAVVDVSVTEDESPSKLEYGSGTPGTMATTPCTPSTLSPLGFASPVSIFASFAASSSRKLFEDNSKKLDATECGTMITEATSTANEDNDTDSVCTNKSSKPLGISKPLYEVEDDDISVTEERIGIDPPDYDMPERDIPLSAFDFFNEKKHKSTKNKLDEGDDDGDNLWQLRLLQSQTYPEIIDEGDEYDHECDPDDNINRLLHKQTSQGRYLFNSRPVDAPCGQLKYSLEHGKSSMSKLQRQVSKRKVLKTRPNVATPSQRDLGIPPAEASHKIFLLLLAPKSKIFEIIQIFYAPQDATVGDVLDLIPANATEPALASQSYTGVCRPKDGIHIEPDAMASAAGGSGTGCARILKGEILIAIPKGYASRSCAVLSKTILANRKVGKLMDRSDPLSKIKKTKKKKRRASTHRNSNGYKCIAVEASHDVENSKEEEEPSVERLDCKERDLLRKAQLEPTDESVPDLLLANSSFGQDSGKSPSSSEVGKLNDIGAKTMRSSSIEVWQTTMSLRSDTSSVSSVDFGTYNEGRRRSVESAINSLPVISADKSFEKIENETMSRNLKGESPPNLTNRVRKASAIIIQSAARRVLAIKRTREQFPQANQLTVIRSKSFCDETTRLHHVCAIIIQAHARALFAKKVKNPLITHVKLRSEAGGIALSKEAIANPAGKGDATAESLDNPQKNAPDLSELQSSLQTKDVSGAIAAFSKILAGIDGNDEMKKQMMSQLQQSVEMKN